MPKEDRSDWVAVAPEHTTTSTSDAIRKVTSTYQFFQKDAAEQIRQEYGKVSDIAQYGRLVKEKWNALTSEQRDYYEQQHQQDVARFAQESHQADIAALERTQKLQQERETLLLDMDYYSTAQGGDDGGSGQQQQRLTRGKWEKKQRKQARKEKKKQERQQRKSGTDDNDEEEWREEEDDDDDDDDSSQMSWDSNASSEDDDSDSEGKKKKKAATKRTPQISQKQLEYRAKQRQEKQEKEEYITSRQEDLRKERSMQAKRRLEYLLKQGGNIFSHFGRVKEDTTKYGIRAADRQRKEATGVARRGSGADSSALATTADGLLSLQPDDEEDQEEALEEADEHEATFLTAQPKTLGFGKMRSYQLEGLNWMIRLQENGVNGILADGTLALCCVVLVSASSRGDSFVFLVVSYSPFSFENYSEMGLGKTLQVGSIQMLTVFCFSFFRFVWRC